MVQSRHTGLSAQALPGQGSQGFPCHVCGVRGIDTALPGPWDCVPKLTNRR
jgi:hypothetical protein